MTSHKNEFSKLIDIKKLNTTPKDYKLIPTTEEMASLAVRFGFEALSSIESALSLTKKGSRIFVEGRITGMIQKDAFSQELPIEENVKVLLFTDKEARDFDASRLEDDIHDAWDCDLLEEETEFLDIGELTAQYLSLSISELEGNVSGEERVIELF